MRAATCKRSLVGRSGGATATRFRHEQPVTLRAPLLDGAGHAVVEAGARGRVIEELDTAPGWWLVEYEAQARIWPTPGAQLRVGWLRPAGRLDLQALQQVVRVLLAAARAKGALRMEADTERAEREIIEYITARAEVPKALIDLVSDRAPSCRCGDSGVCSRCEGRGGRCRSCAGSRICRHCPRPEGAVASPDAEAA
ncbi:MAG: hypothetical protein U1A78_41700 [Polyangia bacterium]